MGMVFVSLFFREIMHAMWKPQKFKYIYLLATLYVFTLTLPSAATVYWAFGDELLNHSNAFSLLPKTRWRDAAVILMLIHQVSYTHTCILSIYEITLEGVWHLQQSNFHIGFFCVRAVYNIWVCMHAVVFRLGEGDRHARHKEHMFESSSEATSCGSNLVFGHYFPFLWSN